MSQEIMEERVGHLENRVGRIETSLAVVSSKQDTQQQQLTSIGQGVEQLLKSEAKRPDPVSVGGVVKTLASAGAAIACLGGFVWWFISTAPAIESLRENDRRLADRLQRLDDPDLGRVPRLERDSWPARITRN